MLAAAFVVRLSTMTVSASAGSTGNESAARMETILAFMVRLVVFMTGIGQEYGLRFTWNDG